MAKWYRYYAVVKTGSNNGFCSEGFNKFKFAVPVLMQFIEKYGSNHVTFAGIVKCKEGTNPFDRIKDSDSNNIIMNEGEVISNV